jgi:hypothetical protein
LHDYGEVAWPKAVASGGEESLLDLISTPAKTLAAGLIDFVATCPLSRDLIIEARVDSLRRSLLDGLREMSPGPRPSRSAYVSETAYREAEAAWESECEDCGATMAWEEKKAEASAAAERTPAVIGPLSWAETVALIASKPQLSMLHNPDFWTHTLARYFSSEVTSTLLTIFCMRHLATLAGASAGADPLG